MLRNDTVICGTSTTGTGTLTLAACPAPPGGIDLYAWLTATGFAFTSGNAVLISYMLIEYTDSTFATAKQYEKGVGTVTLGASLTATTLARTTVQQVASSLNATGTPTYVSPSAISIGTAANTLVFIGPGVADMPAYCPYYDTTTAGIDNIGVAPVLTGGTANGNSLANSTYDYYSVFEWRVPMVVKRCSMRVLTAYAGTGGTPISSAYARIYQINSAGRPGKLLIDFGAFTGTNPLNTAQNIQTNALTNGILLLPGEYFFDFVPVFSGASGTITNPAMVTMQNQPRYGRMGTYQGIPIIAASASGATAGTAPDPANLTGYAFINPSTSPFATANLFFLAPS
jgi:hypothetical protein